MEPSLTTAFDLKTNLKAPKFELMGLPLVDLFCLVLLCSLFFTRYVMLPGVQIDLPTSDLKMEQNDAFLYVLTVGNNEALYFEGSLYNARSIEPALRAQLMETADSDPVLLIKASADLRMESFLELCRLAKNAGFTHVKVAANDPATE